MVGFKKFHLLLLIGVAFSACSDKGNTVLKGEFINEMLHCQRNRIPFCVSKVTSFNWERVYMIHGQNDGWREEQVSGQICGKGFAIGPHQKYVLFLKGEILVDYFQVSKSDVDFYMNPAVKIPADGCFNNYGTPETACYKVSKDYDLIHRQSRFTLTVQR